MRNWPIQDKIYKEGLKMQTVFYIEKWQLPAVNIFIDKFGVDAGCKLMVEFEKHGSLGRAMIDTAILVCAR